MEQGRFLRVQVLWFALPDDTPAECDAFALWVEYGKHDAIEEPVTNRPTIAGNRNICLYHLIGFVSL